MSELKFFTCVCGKKHPINNDSIRCVGFGHAVYIHPEYWKIEEKNQKKSESIKTTPGTLTLFT
jgi:hypothetical protein